MGRHDRDRWGDERSTTFWTVLTTRERNKRRREWLETLACPPELLEEARAAAEALDCRLEVGEMKPGPVSHAGRVEVVLVTGRGRIVEDTIVYEHRVDQDWIHVLQELGL